LPQSCIFAADAPSRCKYSQRPAVRRSLPAIDAAAATSCRCASHTMLQARLSVIVFAPSHVRQPPATTAITAIADIAADY